MSIDAADDPSPFAQYAEVYDALYGDKDYRGEARFVADLLKELRPKSPPRTRVIDLACGTGRHVFELASLGFDVAGSDVSEQMIAMARKAASKRGASIPFHVHPFQTCNRIGNSYDAALAMFASLGYLTTQKDLVDALAAIREVLAPSGLLIFDVWNGLAVLRSYSPVRVKRAMTTNASVIRLSQTTLDEIRQIATVRFDFVLLPNGAAPIEFSETHKVRFFFPREIVDVLSASGFRCLLQCPFLDADRRLEPSDWNFTVVAEKT